MSLSPDSECGQLTCHPWSKWFRRLSPAFLCEFAAPSRRAFEHFTMFAPRCQCRANQSDAAISRGHNRQEPHPTSRMPGTRMDPLRERPVSGKLEPLRHPSHHWRTKRPNEAY